MGRLLRPANEGGFGDILKGEKKEDATKSRNASADLYYSYFDLEELVDNLENWYRWNFDPQKGIYQDSIVKHYEQWELYLSPFGVILGMIRRKRMWDDKEVKEAKNKAEAYKRAIQKVKDRKQ